MIKELLIIIFLFEISKGQMSDFEKCANEDKDSLVLGNICVPSKDGSVYYIWLFPPSDEKTELSITIERLQIIEIDSHTITLSMDFFVKWPEHRVTLKSRLGEVISIRPEDQWKIWSPKISIGNNKVFEKKEQEQFKIVNFYEVTGFKGCYIYTKVTCAMDFGYFPFDKHVCNVEASFNSINS